MTKRIIFFILICAGSIALLTSCDAGDKTSTDEERLPVRSPVTLLMYLDITMTEEARQTLIVEPVRRVYPHIAIQFIDKTANMKLDQLLASGVIPDMIYTRSDNIGELGILGMGYDLSEMIRKYHFDLERIEPQVMESVKVWGTSGEIYAIPYSINFRALYYNKGLFDRFSVNYPQDGMTWEESFEIARKITRTVDGVKYRGMLLPNINSFAAPLSLTYVDPSSNKAVINNEGWKNVFTVARILYEIEGNEFEKQLASSANSLQAFMNEGIVAMYPEKQGVLESLEEAGDALAIEWDLAAYPNFKELPGIYGWDVTQVMAVNGASKHVEDAFLAITALLTDEAQAIAAGLAKVSPLRNPELKAKFGKDIAIVKGKNVGGIFYNLPAKPPVLTRFDSAAQKEMNQAFQKMMESKEDVNTVLRHVEESINKTIAALLEN